MEQIPIFTDVKEWFRFLTNLEPTEDQIKALNEIINIQTKKIIVSAGRQINIK